MYFKVSGVSLTDIGLASLLGLPWTLKVLWSPLVDRFGERRNWITACLLALALCTRADALVRPRRADAAGCGRCCSAITMASATQDIAIDAYTIGLVDRGEEGDANGVRVSAARVALIASGGGLVVLAPLIGWPAAFVVAAALFAVLAVSTRARRASSCRWPNGAAWLAPMRRWLHAARRLGGVPVRAHLQARRRGDGADDQAVLDRPRPVGRARSGWSRPRSAWLATIAGALVGGRLTSRWGILRALLVLGLAQALSNLGYAIGGMARSADAAEHRRVAAATRWQALSEPGRGLIYAASMLESFTSGLGTAAFLAFLMHVCEKEHAAVQYAALSALFALSRDIAGAISGWATTAPRLRPVLRPDLLARLPRPGAAADRAHVDPRSRRSGRVVRFRTDLPIRVSVEGRCWYLPAQRGVELRDEPPVDPVLEPPGPATAPGEGAVAEDGAAVAGVEQGEEARLRAEGAAARSPRAAARRLCARTGAWRTA